MSNVTSWMTVESRFEIFASWEEWFKKVTERTERQAAKEYRAKNIKEVQRRCKTSCGMAEQTDEATAVESKFEIVQHVEKDARPMQRAEKKSEGWQEELQVEPVASKTTQDHWDTKSSRWQQKNGCS